MTLFGRALLVVVALQGLRPAVAAAQGVATGGVEGRVTGPDSTVLAGATVTVTDSSTGERWQAVTGASGRYALEYLSVGGPYTIEARAIGYLPAGAGGVYLGAGQRRRVELVLAAAVPRLEELTVTAAPTVDGATALRLPVPNQDVSRLVLLSPLAVLTRDSGISIAGQSDRLNGFQIDGATNADLGGIVGLEGFGTPGAASGVRTLSIEAVRELQVLVAPLDVRYGNFAGGLVNAVTRSGSNTWRGSVTGYVAGEGLTGADSAGGRGDEFGSLEITATAGGPLVRDRAAVFLDAGLQRFTGAGAPPVTDTAAALRLQEILRAGHGVDPGTIAREPLQNPAGHLLAKVSLWPRVNQRLELSHNYARGRLEVPPAAVAGGDALTSLAAHRPATVHGTRVTWTAAGRGLANELTAARLGSRERCLPAVDYPELVVSVRPRPDAATVGAGTVNSCAGRFADETVWELTDNLSWTAGGHALTVGTHAEAVNLDGSRRGRVPAGRWTFDSMDSLAAGLPSQYLRDVAGSSGGAGSLAEVRVRQLGLYAQDRWSPAPRLTLTAGLRMDVPFLLHGPVRDPTLLASLGLDNSRTPSGNPLWSPRLGFTWDAGGRARTTLRGGAGLFAGRPIYLYFSNVFETNGTTWLRIACRGAADLPDFTLSPGSQPTTCRTTDPAVLEVNTFDPAFRFPRNLRLSLGAEAALPWGLVASADLLYIRGVDQFDVTDVNLAPPSAGAGGEDGRPLYGLIDPATGATTPIRRSAAYGLVTRMRNASGDRAVTASLQLRKRLGGSGELTLAYAYGRARDRMSANCFTVSCNLDFSPLDGTLDRRRLAVSSFDVRYRVLATAVANLPYRFRLGVFYSGSSGAPYTYMVAGDANADGLGTFGGNDIVYLPSGADDVTLADPAEWAGLDSVIRSQGCLRAQRGRIMRRNSCRDGWRTVLNARVSRVFGVGGGQSVELIADLFNLLNLLDGDWGVQRTVRVGQLQGQPQLLQLVGWDPSRERGIYHVLPPDRRFRDDPATRWRIQLGARWTFGR
jgi:hypothetical protein